MIILGTTCYKMGMTGDTLRRNYNSEFLIRLYFQTCRTTEGMMPQPRGNAGDGEGGSTIRLKKWSSVASRRQRERCDVTYALLPTVSKFRWFMFRCCGSHCTFATVGNNAYVTSQRSRCLRDATDDHFLSLIVDSP